jgi:imidazolonepropionase-like amidohydrolase
LNRTLLALAACLVAAPLAPAQEKPVAVTGAHILTISGPEIDNGVLIVQRGKITAIGDASTKVPADATVIDAKGKVVMPGLVDTHSHIGGIGGADGSAPIQPDCRVLDSLSVLDSGFRRAVAGGLTTLNIMPGSGHLMSGQTIYAKMRKAKKIDDIFILDKDGHMMNGLKMANGTNSFGAPPFSGTRSKSAALVREEYVKAQEYKKKMEAAAAKNEPDKAPPRDIGLDFLSEVLDGKRIVHHHTHRADDIMTVLRLQKEFGFRVVLHHVSEAWKVADEIAAAHVPCSVIVIDSPGGKLEAAEMSWATGGVLEKAGVKVAFHTDDWITDSRLFLRSAALAVRAGMSRPGALRALTLSGAEMLDLGDRVGSLEPGKDADFIILSGDPLSVYTHVEQTWVEGQKVFDRTIADDYLHAVGGYGAGKDQRPYMCCAGGFVFGGQQWGMQNYTDTQGGGQ